LYKILDKVYAAHIPALLLSLLRSSHRAEGGATCLLRGEPPADFQLCPLVDVKLKFFVELPLDAIPLE
jgi:hypothetical protein